jgi:zinc transport system substrate-binding protein
MRLRIIFISFVALVFGFAIAVAVGWSGGSTRAGPVRNVVASFYPLAFAAEEAGARGIDVRNLTPPGSEPHDLELSPGRVRAIENADLVLLLGHGFQPQLERAAARSRARVLELLDTPGLAQARDDPHVWLDPVRYALVARRIARALGLPGGPLEARLRALDAEFERGLAHCVRRDLVTSHAAFGYLARRYGLRQVSLEGLIPGAEPSPAELDRVARLVRERGVTTIFFEALVSPKLARTLARETGARTAVLDPLEGLTPRAAAAGEDYVSVMRANLRALREGLGCR